MRDVILAVTVVRSEVSRHSSGRNTGRFGCYALRHLEFDDNFWGSKKAMVAMIPASHLATLSLLVRDLFRDALCHCFLSFFSTHTSLFFCFLGSREVSGGRKAKREQGYGGRISVCHGYRYCIDSSSRFIWLGLLLEEKSDTSLGICPLHRHPADGERPCSRFSWVIVTFFDESSRANSPRI